MVDDDALVRSTVVAMLKAIEFDVTEVPSGKDALRLISNNDFDVIVTDLFMPELDGFELILQIRKIEPVTPIILMTGGGMLYPSGSGRLSDLTSSAEFLGASFVINKPFRKNNFKKIVDQALAQKEGF